MNLADRQVATSGERSENEMSSSMDVWQTKHIGITCTSKFKSSKQLLSTATKETLGIFGSSQTSIAGALECSGQCTRLM